MFAKLAKDAKPRKPYPDYPLSTHASGRWAKKIRQKPHFFGPWRDPAGALDKDLDQRDDLHAGQTPRVTSDGLTIRDLKERFLTATLARPHATATGKATSSPHGLLRRRR